MCAGLLHAVCAALCLDVCIRRSSILMAAAAAVGSMEKGSEEIRVERVRNVKPATKTEVSHMFLSTCDLVCRTYPYINRVLFYETHQHDYDYEALVNTLERGLRSTLVSFYPLAGRLSHDSNGRLQIECNDAGVEFIEASLSIDHGISFSDLLQDDFQYRPLFWKLAPKSNLLRSDYLHEPLLSIQVTSFQDGGLALGVSMSHIIADAQSFYDYMRCWAEMCRSGSMSMPPKHMRLALSVKAMLGEDAQVCKAHQSEQFPIIEKQAQEEELRRPLPNLVQKVFPFSSQMLQQLKAKANASIVEAISTREEGSTLPNLNNGQFVRPGSHASFTTFESFCAHWWQCIVRAKNLPPQKPVCLLIPVNCRQRFLNLPKNYFGNSLDGALVAFTSGELCKENLSTITGRVHEAIVAATEERFKKYITEAEANENAVFHFDRTELFHIMDSPKFPIYGTDFGFGAPKAIRAEGLRYGCEVQIIAGRLGPGSFEFFCALDSASMHRLDDDPLFLGC